MPSILFHRNCFGVGLSDFQVPTPHRLPLTFELTWKPGPGPSTWTRRQGGKARTNSGNACITNCSRALENPRPPPKPKLCSKFA
jgi:hypothetical protein